MSVLLDTSLGDLVIDLDYERCPRTCQNFLKLCKAYKYNYITFFSVQKGFLAQTGDPTNSGNGGQSIWSLLPKDAPGYTKEHYFTPERHADSKHTKRGTVSMACRRRDPDDEDSLVAGSQFFITLGDNLDYLDGRHVPFGSVVEGLDKDEALDKINEAYVGEKDKRPLRDIRIQKAVVLVDVLEDLPGLEIPSRTPSPTPEQLKPIGLDASTALDGTDDTRSPEEIEEERRKREARSNALTLEMIGDLPFAEVRPPENILFVCKLNPITRGEDLELIFSRFGKILSCEVIKDQKTGDSLQYAFVEFDEKESAELAYIKMQNVLVDDRRIHVDFSQSVSKLSNSWNQSRSRGKPVRVARKSAGGQSSSGSVYRRHEHRDKDRREPRRDSDYRHDPPAGRERDRYEYRDDRYDRSRQDERPSRSNRDDRERRNDRYPYHERRRDDGHRHRDEYRDNRERHHQDRDRRDERYRKDRSRSPRRDDRRGDRR